MYRPYTYMYVCVCSSGNHLMPYIFQIFTYTFIHSIRMWMHSFIHSCSNKLFISISSCSSPPPKTSKQSADNWVEEPPQRIPYVAKYVYDVSTKEDSTQVVFITLTSLFVIIVICCLIEVYRSHLAYKRRIERETDEDIIWSKEQATKMHESPGVGGQPYVYKAVSNSCVQEQQQQ